MTDAKKSSTKWRIKEGAAWVYRFFSSDDWIKAGRDGVGGRKKKRVTWHIYPVCRLSPVRAWRLKGPTGGAASHVPKPEGFAATCLPVWPAVLHLNNI